MEVIKFVIGNSCDIGDIIYNTGWQQVVYFQGDLFKPEYEFSEEGTEDGEGNFIKQFDKVLKRYKLIIFQPENIADGLYLLPLHKAVVVTLPDGRSEKVVNIEVANPDWENEGCRAEIEVSFITESYNYNSSRCCDNLSVECYTADTEVCAILTPEQYVLWQRGDGANWVSGCKYLVVDPDTNDAFLTYINDEGKLTTEDTIKGNVYQDASTLTYYASLGSRVVQLPYIYSGGYTGLDVLIKAYAFPNTLAQLYVDGVATGDPFNANVLKNTGYTWTAPGVGTYALEIKNYLFDCDYGYSNEKTIIVA